MVERSLIKTVTSMFVELGREVYVRDFEAPFLASSATFYQAESQVRRRDAAPTARPPPSLAPHTYTRASSDGAIPPRRPPRCVWSGVHRPEFGE